MTKPDHPPTIGSLAEQAGVNSETVLCYIERALADPVERCSAASRNVRCPLIASLPEA
ncbi:MAG: hypothetical protein RQ826_14560 [Xanthomonadales bacterium]|nr:hypothetical protein [Xanthomonadales bacterium]